MYLTDGWYWNQSPNRAHGRSKFFGKMKRMPSMLQAGDYSAVKQYLTAVKAAGTDDADAVMAQLKKQKINDMFAKGGYIRPDGRMIHEMYLMQVKTPAESKEPWDYFKVAQTIPGDQAYQPLADIEVLAGTKK